MEREDDGDDQQLAGTAAAVAAAAKPKVRSRISAKLMETRSRPFRVVSIDVGLRNLGLAVVSYSGGADSFEAETLLFDHLTVEHAENVDLLEENECSARNAKSLGPLRQISFWHTCMMNRKALMLDPPPDMIVVEVQDGGNATMRQVSTGIVGLFVGHFEARFRDGMIPRLPMFTMVRGDMKMKVCEAILESTRAKALLTADQHRLVKLRFEHSTAAAASAAAAAATPAASAAAPAPPPAYLLKINPRRYYMLHKAWKEASGGGGKATPEAIPQGPEAIPQGPEAIPQGPEAIPHGPEAIPQGPEEPPAKKQRRVTAGRSRGAYEMRKKTAVLAFETYVELSQGRRSSSLSSASTTAKKQRDISDAVLQGMYVICRHLKVTEASSGKCM
jgi:hypothetical protein